MAPTEGTLMVPAHDADVAQLALIEAMRMSNDKIDRIASAVEKLNDKFDEVVKDTAVLKAQDHQKTIDAMIERQTSTENRIADLLSKSLEDRKNLWLAVEARKAEITNVRDKVLPILALGTTITAAVVAVIVKQVLG